MCISAFLGSLPFNLYLPDAIGKNEKRAILNEALEQHMKKEGLNHLDPFDEKVMIIRKMDTREGERKAVADHMRRLIPYAAYTLSSH